MTNFDFQHLILNYYSNKHVIIKKIWVDFFTKSTIFIIDTFHHSISKYIKGALRENSLVVLRFRLTCPQELMSPTHTFPRHTLVSDTHMYPTHTCTRHTHAPDTQMHPNTLAPNTHLHPTHTCTRHTHAPQHTCTRHTLVPDTHMYPRHTLIFFILNHFTFSKNHQKKFHSNHGPNISTTPLRQWHFCQCLTFSWKTLRGKHCRLPNAVMGVVDTFGHILTKKAQKSQKC
jgi:hypothetical protein